MQGELCDFQDFQEMSRSAGMEEAEHFQISDHAASQSVPTRTEQEVKKRGPFIGYHDFHCYNTSAHNLHDQVIEAKSFDITTYDVKNTHLRRRPPLYSRIRSVTKLTN